ncbi:hypothetical protein AALA24_12215 [Anaerovoracaceae bacterium 42-11]
MRKPLFSRKDNLLVLMLVLSMILFASCGEEAAEKNKLNEKDYKWDVTQLDVQNEGLSDEEQAKRMEVFGQMFRSIFFDDSKEADRVIGTIDGKNITARDFELRALKIREGGEEYPYEAAWETMKQEAAELQYIKKQNCYDDFLDLADQVFRETKTAYSEDEQFRKYCDEQKKLFGLTDEEYWFFMEEANQRIQFHLLVQDYIKQNDYPAIDIKTIEYSLQDEEYKDKVSNKR